MLIIIYTNIIITITMFKNNRTYTLTIIKVKLTTITSKLSIAIIETLIYTTTTTIEQIKAKEHMYK